MLKSTEREIAEMIADDSMIDPFENDFNEDGQNIFELECHSTENLGIDF